MIYNNEKIILTEKQKNSIYGFIIGDCLGVPYEFSKSNNLKSLKFIGHQSHNQLPGTWSDDTAFILATLDSNIDNIQEVTYNFKEVLKGKYTVDNNLFDVGHNTKTALLYPQLNDNTFQGNGALMRMLPLAFVTFNNYYNSVKIIAEITHNSEISNICCLSYLHVINNALQGFFNFINTINLYLFKDTQIKKLSYNELKTIDHNGWCFNSLNIVLNICELATSYQHGIKMAINLGGDTDTHAALVGAILALKFNDWKKYKKGVRNISFVEDILK